MSWLDPVGLPIHYAGIVWSGLQSWLTDPPKGVTSTAAAAPTPAAAKVATLVVGAFITAAVGALFTIGNNVGRWLLRKWRAFFDLHLVDQKLQLKPVKLEAGELSRVDIYCLLVRYGTDLYYEKLASDQERYEGRLQNRILHNRGKSTERWLQSLFELPVHNRLGTQFKFFLEVVEIEPRDSSVLLSIKDKIEETQRKERYYRFNISFLKGLQLLVSVGENAEQAAANALAPSAERIMDEKSSAYKIACRLADDYGLPKQDIVRRYKRAKGRKSVLCYRLWFTLADFPRVRTADGLENNMAFPI